MSGSTWTWIGGAINLASPGDWALTSGPGNASDLPETGDTAINNGTLVGYGLIAATFINNGMVEASNNIVPTSSTGGGLEIQGAISGTGSMTIEPGATLQIDGSLGTGQSIVFAPATPGTPETLILGSPTSTIPNSISGYGSGDKIEFTNGITTTSANLVNVNTLAIGYTNSLGVAGTFDLTDVALAAGTPVTFDTNYIDAFTGDEMVMLTQFPNWTTVNGDFGNPASWNNGVVPDADDFATFGSASGGTISGTGTAFQLSFANTGTWSLQSGTNLTATEGVFVGSGGNPGTLTVGAGSTILTGGYLDVGNLAGSAGVLTVSGGGVVRDTGPAIATDIMVIGVQSASGGQSAATGDVTVTGPGSVLDLGGVALIIGDRAGTSGTLTISSGGSFSASTPNSSSYPSVATGRLGNGTITVTGAGSEMTATGTVHIAYTATGILTIDSSATFLAATDATGQAGVSIGLGNTTGVGGAGIATVSSSGNLISQGNVNVGRFGTTGQLNVNNGTVQVGTTLTVGEGGTISNGMTEIGSGTLAIVANGTVVLTGAAQTTAYGVVLGYSNIGTHSAETAVATVTGPLALLNTNDNGLAVGLFGTASLTVSQGGTVLAGIAAPGSIAALSIGNQGSGTVSVSGAGSQLTAAGNLAIGAAGGSGSLTVSNNGAVTITGPVKMAGAAGISLDVTGEIEIGGSGHAVAGEMVIDSGGALSGSGLLAGAIADQGGITAIGGTLELNGAVTGAGTLSIATGSSMQLDDSAAASLSVAFAPSGGDAVLALGAPLALGALIENFAPADSIEFAGNYGTVSEQFSGDTMAVIGDGATIANLLFTGGYDTTKTSVTEGGGTVTITASAPPIIIVNTGVSVTPGLGQTVSLTQIAGDPHLAPGGTIQSLYLSGLGTDTASGTIAVNNLEVNSGLLSLDGGYLNTDPVTIDAQGNISGFGTISGAVSNVGTITASGGTLELTGGLSGIGTLISDAGSALLLDAGGAAGAAQIDGGVLNSAGEFDAAQSGLGGILIESEGTVATGTTAVSGEQGLEVAKTSKSSGQIVVSGTKSLLTNKGSFIVGDGGLGNLSIAAGGTVTTTPGTVPGLAGLVIANTPAASGSSVNLSGAGSNLQITGSLIVGDAGYGSLSLSQGATVTAASLDVAAGASGDGAISIAGSGTTLDIAGSLTLGDQAAGELSILGGAQMTIAGGVIGGTSGAGGNLDIEGSGSQLTINGGTLVVGENGPAEFTLGIGATLSGEVSTDLFGVTNEYGIVDPATDPVDGTQNVGFGSSSAYDFYVANSGTIHITSGTATFYTPLVTYDTDAQDGSVNGLWQIGAKDTLVMNATSVDNSQTFDLTSAVGATLVIGQVPQGNASDPDTFNGQTMPTLTGSIAPGAANVLAGWDAPIANYASGDVITLAGLTYGSATAAGDVVTVWSGPAGGGNALGSLTFIDKNDNPSSTEAALAATQINALACFAAGTRIATVDGPAKVEDLRVGDRVVTPDGRSEPVVWVGSRTVNCRAHPKPETVWPVRVRAWAFGGTVPERDLWLSPDHALFLDGVLVPVKLLINGTSIAQKPRDQVTYYHVELPEHAVILAERLPVESYLDTGDRETFDARGTIRLFPDFAARPAPDAATAWEMSGAAPLVITGPRLEAVRRASTAARAGVEPRDRATRRAPAMAG